MLIIVGKMSSGKDTVVSHIIKKGWQKAVPYTTRPKRLSEVEDVDYHFLTEKEFEKLISEDFFAEYAEYNAVFGHCYYGSAREDYSQSSDKQIIILNPIGLKQIVKNGIKETVDVVYLDTSEDVIRKRVCVRGDDKKEVERRILADAIDFEDIDKYVDFSVNGDGLVDDIVAKILSHVSKTQKLHS